MLITAIGRSPKASDGNLIGENTGVMGGGAMMTGSVDGVAAATGDAGEIEKLGCSGVPLPLTVRLEGGT